MVLSDVSVKRPVFATVVSLLIVVFGISALMKLPIREYPDIDPPQVSVEVTYEGAAPEVLDTQIIQVVEGAIAGVEGVSRIESRSRLGSARTSVEFDLDRDLDIAANDVRDAVSRIINQLPEEAEAPVIAKSDSDARPIIWVTLSSDTLATQELTDFAERSLVDRFAVLDGVSEVNIGGERRYAMRVWLDRQRMAANGIAVNDIATALRAVRRDCQSPTLVGVRADASKSTRASTPALRAAIAAAGHSVPPRPCFSQTPPRWRGASARPPRCRPRRAGARRHCCPSPRGRLAAGWTHTRSSRAAC